MKNITLIMSFLFFSILLFGQDVIKLSGKVEMTANPCITEECLPVLIWGLNVDTATFILTKNKNWIWDTNPLVIYEIGYSEGDNITLYGQLSISQDWDGEDFYELEIVNKRAE